MIVQSALLSSREDLDAVLMAAVEQQASDVHMGGDEPIRIRKHGIVTKLAERLLNQSEIERLLVVSYDNTNAISKVNSGHEIDYSYTCKNPVNGNFLRWRVNAGSRSRLGRKDIKMVFRHIISHPPSITDLKVESDIVGLTTHLRKGLVIVTGPTGSGKSTLLAAIMRNRLEQRAEHLITLEAPIEYIYDDIITQSTVTAMEVGDGKDCSTFARGLVGTLRKDPDVILVGEARDRETIGAALHGTQTGHALFTTVHTNGVANTISRILAAFDDSEKALVQMDLIDSLSLIVYQSLVESLDGKRIALREYLVFDGKVKDMLRECEKTKLFTECYRALLNYGQTLLMDAKAKFEAGLISEKVLHRIQKEFEADMGRTEFKTEKLNHV